MERAGWMTFGGLAGLVIALADASTAAACSQPYPEPSEPCRSLQVIAPAEAFPLNLEGELRVALYTRDEWGSHAPAEDFALDVPLTVARRTTDGYEDVAYDLVDEPDLVPNARALRLRNPIPGEYVVSWGGESCETTPSPDGRGMLLRALTITEELPLPDELGVASSAGQELLSQTFSLGIDGTCEPITADAVLARNTIEVKLSDLAQPWAPVMQSALYVDGELFRGFAAASTESGVLSMTVDHICETDDPNLRDSRPNRLGEGRHEAYVVTRLGDLAEIQSSTTTFEIDCAGGGGGGGGAGGCSLAGAPPDSDLGWLLLTVGGSCLAIRRRGARRRGRAGSLGRFAARHVVAEHPADDANRRR